MLIAGDRIWTLGALREGLAIETDGTTVTALRPIGRDKPDVTLPILMPGCTDLQVNGGGGVLFNTDPTPEGLAAIAAAHHRLGTVAILPTLITDAPEVMDAAADAVIAARGLKGIEGIHLEGPHIAPERRGTHDARFIRPFDGHTLSVLRRLREADIPVMLTLAPELADPAMLRVAAAMGVVVSAGHSMASAEQARAALSEGVQCFTHLYNAMPPMSSRAPGIVAAAILSDAWVGMITDGIHVSPEALSIALAARPRNDRSFIVSDAMPTVGGPDEFTLYGQQIRVQDGALVNAEGALAGAHIDMLGSIRRLVALTGTSLDRAIAMATDIPRQVMRLSPLQVAPGMALTDLVALDDTLALIDLPE